MPKRIPPNTIRRVKLLRSKGWTLTEIYKRVGIGYGSVFRYIKNVKILPQYKDLWQNKRNGSIKRKYLAEKLAQSKATKKIASLSEKEKLIIITCLYWAEGNKRDFSFTNTDPEMIKIFVKILNILGIPKERLKVTIRTYEDLDKEKCVKYWSQTIGISIYQVANVNIIKGKKAGKLTYGMCRIRIIKGGVMLKYMIAAKNRIVEVVSGLSQ